MPRAGLDVNVAGVVLGTSGVSSSSSSLRWFSVVTEGATGNGIQLTDGVTASGSAVLTSASAAFSAATDIGKQIAIGQKLPSVSNVTGGSPIVITTSANHGLANGQLVQIRGVQGSLAANGPWTVAGVTANTFQLSGSGGLGGAYAGGGTVYCPFMTTISAVGSPTSITLATSVGAANGSASTFVYGTDDTAAFTSAAAKAAANHGGIIYVPAPVTPGTRYLVRHPNYAGGNSLACFRIASNCTLLGDGPASVIQELPPLSGQVFDILASTNSFYVGLGGSSGAAPSIIDHDILVTKLTFDASRDMVIITGAGGGGTEHAMYFSRVNNVNISDVTVQNCGADGIVYEFSSSSSIDNVASTNCGKVGAYLSGSYNCNLSSGTSFANDGGGIVLALARSCSVIGYNIDTWGSPAGTFAGIMLVGDTRYCSVTGNTISNGSGSSLGAIGLYNRTVGATPSPVFGLSYNAGSDPSGAFPYGASFNTISGNTIRGNAGIGIFLQDYCDYNTITGNNISGCGGVGIQVQGAQFNHVVANKIYNNNPTGILLVSSLPNRASRFNRVEHNEGNDVVVQEFTPLTGTVTTNGTTALAGAGTSFTTEIAPIGPVNPPIPIIIQTATENVRYHYVVNVVSNTSLTLAGNAATSLAGLTVSAPKISNQLTHPVTTQLNAIVEQNVASPAIVDGTGTGTATNPGFVGTDDNYCFPNRIGGLITLIGKRSKADDASCRYAGSAQAVASATQTALPFANTSGSDNDQMHVTSISNLTGTVTKTTGQNTLVGVGTLFLSELVVGQVIWVPGTANEFRVVSAIKDNLNLVVAGAAWANTAGAQTATRDNTGFVFRTPGFYSIVPMVSTPVQVAGTRRDIIIQLNATSATVAAGLVTATVGGTAIAQMTRDQIATGAGIFNDMAPVMFKANQWDYIQLQVFQDSGASINFTPTMMISRISGNSR
jgi:parallel beta-helix repeat protein